MKEARVLPAFLASYPALKGDQWYPLSDRGVDDVRPGGASSSGGGPTQSGGLWVRVDGRDQFVFRHHVEVRTTGTR